MKESIYRYPSAEKYREAQVRHNRRMRRLRKRVIIIITGAILVGFLVSKLIGNLPSTSMQEYWVHELSDAQLIYHFSQGSKSPIILVDRDTDLRDTIFNLDQYLAFRDKLNPEMNQKPEEEIPDRNSLSLD